MALKEEWTIFGSLKKDFAIRREAKNPVICHQEREYMRYSLLAILLGVGVTAFSQDISNQTQFFFNAYTINPSYAGTEGRPAFFLSYRKQWTGVTGSPAISNFSFHNASKGKLNYGLNFNSDSRGIVSTTSAMGTIGYTLPIDENTTLRFGLSGGIGFNGVDVAQLGSFTDKILPSILNRNSFLMGNAGVSVHRKDFHGGIALPNLFQPVYVSSDPFSVSALRPFQSAIIHVSNRFYFDKDKNVFEPYLMYRLNGSGLPSQLEAAALLHLQHFVWVGASYRQNFGISALGGIKIKNQFAIGFSYSVKNTGINELNSPTYELQLGYLTGFKKKGVFAYSFVSTEKEKVHKKTPKEIAEERKKQQAEIARKQQEEKNKVTASKKGAEDKKAVALKEEEDRRQKALAVAALKAEEDRKLKEKLEEDRRIAEEKAHAIKFPVDSTHHEDLQQLKRIADHAEEPNAEHGLGSDQHENHERHEIVVRGGHSEELDLGDFVIAGSFMKRENAARYDADLTKLGFTADFAYLSSHAKWYVYIYHGTDINEARTERDKHRKLKLFRDAWLLTVREK